MANAEDRVLPSVFKVLTYRPTEHKNVFTCAGTLARSSSPFLTDAEGQGFAVCVLQVSTVTKTLVLPCVLRGF